MADKNSALTGPDDLDDEILPDWGIINKSSTPLFLDPTVETIPRRSEKYFDQDGSSTQVSRLEESRNQMYLALLSVRGHHVKLLLIAVWIPEKKMALVPHAKGNFFKDIGVAHNFKHKKKLQGMWLSSIETVYLTERGSLITYLANEKFNEFIESEDQEFPYESLFQLSMSHLYSLAFGSDPDMRDQYQVYALLKRSGYIIMAFRQYFPQYEAWQQLQLKPIKGKSYWSSFKDWLGKLGLLSKTLYHTVDFRRRHFFDYALVFQSLQAMRSYSAFDSLNLPPLPDKRYEITFNVWKPNTAFSKKNPPIPDFQVCVLNIAKTPFPTLPAIQSMWNQLNFSFTPKKVTTASSTPKKTSNKNQQPTKKELIMQRKLAREAKLDAKVLERNKYLKLRDSKLKTGVSGRSIVLATIDNGIINFNALNETEFKLSTKHCVEDLNEIIQKPSHGIVWNLPLRT